MRIDLSDVLIFLGVVLLSAGLYFIAWPLVLVAIGFGSVYVGIRRVA